MTVRAIVLILMLLFLGPSLALAQEGHDQVLVVVDRSAAMGPDAARAWVEKILSARPEHFNVVVTSFRQGLAGAEPLDQGAAVWTAKDPVGSHGFDPQPILAELAGSSDQSRWAMVLLVVGSDPTPLNVGGNRGWLHEPLYASLASEYLEWEQAQATPKEMQDYFGPFYAQQQMALMADHARTMNRGLSSRILIWDISEQAQRLRTWAVAAQIRLVAKQAGDAAHVVDAVDALRWETQRILNSRGGIRMVSVDSGSWGALIVVVLSIAAAGGGWWWWNRNKRAAPVAYNPHQFLFDAPIEFDAPPQPPRPIQFQAQLPAGALEVNWCDAEGRCYCASGLNLTPTQVEFRAAEGTPTQVESLICPSLDVVLFLDSCQVETTADGVTIATFQQFQNGVDDRMTLIDLVTRIGEG